MSDDKQLDAALVAALSVPQFAPLARHISVLREKVDDMRAELFAMRRDRQSERKADAYAEKRSAAARELADLRAYKERTEAGLQLRCEALLELLKDGDVLVRRYAKTEIDWLKQDGLWRDPPQAEVQP